MKISNILMKPELVRASLDGLKTNTRRLRGLDEVNENPGDWRGPNTGILHSKGHRHDGKCGVFFCRKGCNVYEFIPHPWGGPGDLVYVREPFGYEIRSVGGTPHEQIVYRASKPDAVRCYDCNGVAQPMKWRPSIHMPRWASRLTLRLKEVRVERLQDISEENAKAEGAPYLRWKESDEFPCYRAGFYYLWQDINGPASWDANPWLWVLVYEPIAMNVDQVLKLEAA